MRPSEHIVLLFFLIVGPCWANPTPSELAQGIQAYQEERLKTALGHFIQALESDPSNQQAQTYVKLIAQKLQERQIRRAREEEVAILAATSKLMEDRRMDSRIVDQDLQQVVATQKEREEADRHAKCTEAQMEAQLGRLCVANDLVLQVIAQNPADGEAQRLLSDLQSQIHQTLDQRKDLSVPDRRALEGFYAYGQADYASAEAAWAQARSALERSLPAPEAAHQVALLHFSSYEKIARAHLDEELEAARIRVLFADGIAAYEKQDFDKALGAFRQVALASPTYPQLGQYLVQSEAAVERKRTSDLTDAKRTQTAQSFAKGLASLEKEDYAQAKAFFEEVLAVDPAHPQAKLYIQQIDTQKNRRVDPAAAQQHYEAGVIAYVSGDSQQAVREWHIAQRLDPDNPKIADAAHKVERELDFSKELP
jgi:hypothetical protein